MPKIKEADPIAVLTLLALLYCLCAHLYNLSTSFIFPEYSLKPGNAALDLYLALLLLFCTAGAALYALKQKRSATLPQHSLKIGIFLTGIVFVWRLYLHDLVPVWLDEDNDLIQIRQFWSTAAAANSSQPPIHYVLLDYLDRLRPFTDILNLRFNSVLFSSLSTFVIHWVFAERARNVMAGILFAITFNIHEGVGRYSYEARPIALAFFATLIFFLSLVRSVESKQPLFLTISSLFLLLSIGMQAPTLVVAAAIVVAALAFWQNKYLKTLFLPLLTALALFLPFQAKIIYQQKNIAFKTDALNSVASKGTELMSNNFGIALNVITPFLPLLALLTLVSFAAWYFQRRRNYLDAYPSLVTLGSAILFISIIVPVFSTFVVYDLKERYFYALLPLIIFLISELLRLSAKNLSHAMVHGLTTLLLLITPIILHAKTYPYTRSLSRPTNTFPVSDLKAAYELISDDTVDSSKKSVILPLCLRSAEESGYTPWQLIAPEFYLPAANEKLFYITRHDSFNRLLSLLDRVILADRVYFFVDHCDQEQQVLIEKLRLSHSRLYLVHDGCIIKSELDQNTAGNIKNLFLTMAQSAASPNIAYYYQSHIILTKLALQENSPNTAKEHLNAAGQSIISSHDHIYQALVQQVEQHLALRDKSVK